MSIAHLNIDNRMLFSNHAKILFYWKNGDSSIEYTMVNGKKKT